MMQLNCGDILCFVVRFILTFFAFNNNMIHKINTSYIRFLERAARIVKVLQVKGFKVKDLLKKNEAY